MYMLKLIISIVLAIASLQTSATELPYSKAGIIDAIYAEDNRVIINDRSYPIAPYVIVYQDGNKFIGLNNLQTGQAIGFNTAVKGNDSQVLEAWILDKLPEATDLQFNNKIR